MKLYEEASDYVLTQRTPIILRLDGRSFHKLTKKMNKPFDNNFSESMENTTKSLVEEIDGAVFGYTYSDEISILLVNYTTFETEPWFGNRIQKMVSTSSSRAAIVFLKNLQKYFHPITVEKFIGFDARVFILPKEEVVNYFIWRQNDCIRNSVASLAQSVFSHKQLHKKNVGDMKTLLQNKGHDWENLHGSQRFGKYFIDFQKEAPVFKDNRDLIQNLVDIPMEE